jgi:hypothetical protein
MRNEKFTITLVKYSFFIPLQEKIKAATGKAAA